MDYETSVTVFHFLLKKIKIISFGTSLVRTKFVHLYEMSRFNNINYVIRNTLWIALFAILAGCKENTSEGDSKPSTTALEIVYLTVADTSSLLMSEDDFWELIAQSRVLAGGDYQRQIETLKVVLQVLEPTNVEKFANTFTAIMAASYDARLWGASYVINGGCSDDCFEYFREYLIGHGKEKFYQTLRDPDSCVDWIRSEGDDNWQGLRYSAMEVYKEKTGNEMPFSYQTKYELKGALFDENTVDAQYPKLANKF